MPFRRIAIATALVATFSISTADAAELGSVITTAMTDSNVPAVGTVILRDGRIADEAVRGAKRNDRTDTVTLDDAWLIGSTGKVMTVAMVGRLVEHGILSWSTPLDKMLPELASDMRPEYRKVTLEQLLSHRAGLPRDIRDLKLLDRYFDDTRPLRQQRLSYIAEALKDAPETVPGTAFSYSNTGFLIAAVIAERATGKSYEDLMQEEVFGPLGMSHTGLGNTHDGQIRGHRNGKPKIEMHVADDGAPDMYAPAGFLHMSLGDWARFNLDQLAGAKGKGKLLAPATYRLMQTAQPGSPAGLDWGVQTSIAGRKGPVLVHQGSDGNWLAMAILFPEQGTGVLAVANAAADMGADKVLKSVVSKVLPDISTAK